MARAAATFRQSDLDRALKCAVKAGLQVAGYRIARDGTIEILTGTIDRALPSMPSTDEDIVL